jgi:hypothetical protein
MIRTGKVSKCPITMRKGEIGLERGYDFLILGFVSTNPKTLDGV